MTRRSAIALAIISSLAFAGPAMAQDEDVAKGKKVFNKCKACHAVGEGAKKKIGPVLNDVMGAKAGSREGFSYSAAMVEAGTKGTVWDEVTIDKYLENPRDFIPKNKMAFPGLRKPEDRKFVIIYLKQFSQSQ